MKVLFRSHTLNLLAFLVVLLAIPLTVFIAQQQQELRQRAQETAPTPSPTIEPTLTATPSTSTPTPSPNPTLPPAGGPASYLETATPTQSPSATVEPTQPTATPASTSTPTPTLILGRTKILFSLKLGGIGSGRNPNPVNTHKPFNVQVFNSNAENVVNKNGTISYDRPNEFFISEFDTEAALQPGQYNIKVTVGGYLAKLISDVQITTPSSDTTVDSIPAVTLTVGDINNDNELSIADYNILVGCFGGKANTSSCEITNRQLADLNDDGAIDGIDYNIFLRNLSTATPVQSKISSPHSISIIGDSYCVSRTNESLDLLKNKAPIHYDTIVRYIGIVECAQSGSGIYVWENPPRALIGKAILDASVIWHAGGLAHEACHSKLYNDYKLNNSNVPIDVYSGRNAEAQCLDIQYDALSQIGASQWDLDYIKNVINTDYWNVPYENRWW